MAGSLAGRRADCQWRYATLVAVREIRGCLRAAQSAHRPASPALRHRAVRSRRTPSAISVGARHRREAQPQVACRGFGAEVGAAGGDGDARAQGGGRRRRSRRRRRAGGARGGSRRTGRAGGRVRGGRCAGAAVRVSRRAVNSAETARRWRLPGGGADEFQGGLLEGARDEEGVDDLDGAQAFQDRARGRPARPPAGSGEVALVSERDMDDDTVGVVGGERRRAAGPRPRARAGGRSRPRRRRRRTRGRCASTSRPRSGESTAPVGFWKSGWQHEDPGAGGPEGVGEQVGPDAVRVHRDRDGPQSGGAGDRQHARVRGRLDQHRRAGRGERAQRGGQRGLAARGDQHLGGGDGRRRSRGRTSPAARAARPAGGRSQAPGRRPPGPGRRPWPVPAGATGCR